MQKAAKNAAFLKLAAISGNSLSRNQAHFLCAGGNTHPIEASGSVGALS
jgi:hypothetical protein